MREWSGAERLDGGGPPGAWRIFYLHERCHAMACASARAGPRTTNRGGAPLARIDDGPVLHFSNTTRKGIAKLVGPCPPSSIISGYVSRILGLLPPLNVNRKFYGMVPRRHYCAKTYNMNGVLGVSYGHTRVRYYLRSLNRLGTTSAIQVPSFPLKIPSRTHTAILR